MRCAARRMLYATIGLLFCLMTIILAGCQSSTVKPKPTALPDSQQVLRLPLVGQKDLSGLDPATVADANSLAVLSLVYPGLVTLNANQQADGQCQAEPCQQLLFAHCHYRPF